MTNLNVWQQKKRRLAAAHLIFGGALSICMLILFIWPGLIGGLLLDMFLLDMPANFSIEWVINGILNLLTFVALAPILTFAPVVATIVFLLIGVPSVVGGVQLVQNR